MGHAKSSDPNVFILPDLGEGVHEAELLKWRVKEGQTVAEHEVLADMETDKAVVEVPSPRAGTIATLHGSEGEILKVGNALVTYVASGGAAKGAKSEPVKVESKVEAKAEAKVDAPKAEREDAGTVVGSVGGGLAGMDREAGKALATPVVRRLARDLGVDIDAIAGSGIGGRVLEKDVRAAVGGGKPAPSRAAVSASASAPVSAPVSVPAKERVPVVAAAAPVAAPAAAPARAASFGGSDETLRVPFRGVRRTIANRLRESVNQAVHFTVMDEADASACDALRRKLGAASGEKVSFLPFVCAALCRVLGQSQYRSLNATVDEKPGDASYDASIVQHRAIHLGIATDTDNGLMVPVIRDCDRLGVLEIGRHIEGVANAARNRTASREQLMGSTFTVSNVGSYAGRFATPIINYPEVGILAVGRAREGVVVSKGAMRVGLLMPLSLACDHRVVDGATAAMALAEVVKLIQEPEQLMGPAR